MTCLYQGYPAVQLILFYFLKKRIAGMGARWRYGGAFRRSFLLIARFAGYATQRDAAMIFATANLRTAKPEIVLGLVFPQV
jgi:hypothetical protein